MIKTRVNYSAWKVWVSGISNKTLKIENWWKTSSEIGRKHVWEVMDLDSM